MALIVLYTAKVVQTNPCKEYQDKNEIVFDCAHIGLESFPSDIPENTTVLMFSYNKIQNLNRLATLGLNHLKVLDVSYNQITQIKIDTFINTTFLEHLDIRGNTLLSSSDLPNGVFVNLVNMKTLKIQGAGMSSKQIATFIRETRTIKSLKEFVIQNVNITTGVALATSFPSLEILEFHKINGSEEQNNLLYELRNLNKLVSLTIRNSTMRTLGNYSNLAWMSNIKHINLACSKLRMVDTIRYLGSQSSLSNLNTLVIDHCKVEHDGSKFLPRNLFCNASFSHNLQRFSMQRVGAFGLDVDLWQCLPNLRSINFGHNIPFFYQCKEHLCGIDSVISGMSSIDFIKANHLNDLLFTPETFCNNNNFVIDQYFLDESLLTENASRCSKGGNLNESPAATYYYKEQLTDYSAFPEEIKYLIREKLLKTGYLLIYIPLRCVRIFQVQYMTVNSFADGISNWTVVSNRDNRLEHIDFSYSSISPRGWSMINITVVGLYKLKILILRKANINRLFNINLTNAHSLTMIDLSQNLFELMSDEEFSLMFSQPISVRNLNFSSCAINHLPEKFLWQFPNVTTLDLSNNKLKDLNLDLCLNHGETLTLNLSRNYLTSLNEKFIQNIELENKKRFINLLLFNNTFRCDCDTKSFVHWFQTTTVTIGDKKVVSCSYRGTTDIQIEDVNLDKLYFECVTLYTIVTIIAVIVLATPIVAFLCFKYRWHLRWHWYQIKRKLLRSNYQKDALLKEKRYACFVNYFGVEDQWIMEELVKHIEEWDIGEVFVFGRDAIAGIPAIDNIMEAINQSEKLLYVVGKEPKVGEVEWFHTSLRYSTIERLDDIFIVYKDLVPFMDLLQEIPLLKSLCKPKKNSPIKIIQLEANDIFWPELKQRLAQSENVNMYCL